ncbi:MAG: VOC family protein [Gammaproteobacteria bacterium]|nr:VOC family protein [Gammaproteobacteria bacterium]
MTFKIVCIDHIVLRTKNIDKMLWFYRDLLNGTVENIQPQIKLTQIRAGDNLIDLLEVDEPIRRESRNLEHFCLRISPFNYEELKTYFENHGVTVQRYGHRHGAQGLGWSFYVSDPEGNEIELTESH